MICKQILQQFKNASNQDNIDSRITTLKRNIEEAKKQLESIDKTFKVIYSLDGTKESDDISEIFAEMFKN